MKIGAALLSAVLGISFLACSDSVELDRAAAASPRVSNAQPAATPDPKTKGKEEGVIWSGRSGNYEIVRTKDDLIARGVADGKQVFSVKNSVADRVKNAYRDHFAEGKPTFEEITLGYTVVGAAGPYLFLKETFAATPQTSTGEKFYAVDLSNGGGELALTKFAEKEKIFDALMKNSDVAATLSMRRATPKSLDELKNVFSAARAEGSNAGPLSGCSMPQDLMRSFVLKPTEDGSFKGILGISCQSGMRDDELRNIPLDLALTDIAGVDVGQAQAFASALPKDADEVYVRYKP